MTVRLGFPCRFSATLPLCLLFLTIKIHEGLGSIIDSTRGVTRITQEKMKEAVKLTPARARGGGERKIVGVHVGGVSFAPDL